MKKISLFLAISLFLSLALSLSFRAQAVLRPVCGPATINFSAMGTKLSFVSMNSKTNHIITFTNSSQMYNSLVTNFVFNSSYLLGLLSNSLNTNLPADAILFMAGSGNFAFYVTDSTGSNIVLNSSTVGTVLSSTYSVRADLGTEAFYSRLTASGTTDSRNDTEVYTELMILSYDDRKLTTRDGTHSAFQFSGMLVEKVPNNVAPADYKESVSLPGSGGGWIHDRYVALKGSLSAALAGVLTP